MRLNRRRRGPKPAGKHKWVNDRRAQDATDRERIVQRCWACGTLDFWPLARDACPMANKYVAKQNKIDVLAAGNEPD